VHVHASGLDGVSVENCIVSSFEGVTVASAKRVGFNFFGQNVGAAGTSVVFQNCFANYCAAAGFRLFNMTYCAFVGCAADPPPDGTDAGYKIEKCNGISFSGCGCEDPPRQGWRIMNSSRGVTLQSCWLYLTDDGYPGIRVENSSGVNIIGCSETDPEDEATAVHTDETSTVWLMGNVFISSNTLGAATTVV
jgi:hypothetical protein